MKVKYLSVFPMVVSLVLSGISLVHAETFTQNLYFGLQGNAQVSQLQEFLASQNLYSGPITGNFYFLTLNAVKAFQAQQGISPAAGYFGPLTIAAANKIADVEVGASNNEAISETGTSTPPTQGSSTVQLQLQALLQQVALLQQQLAAQQSSTQAIQTLQTQVQQQTQTIQQQAQTIQQIASNTQNIAASVPPPAPLPTATISANPATLTIGSSTMLTWSSTNSDGCLDWNSAAIPFTGTRIVKPTAVGSASYAISCSGRGGISQPATVTITVSPIIVGATSINISADPYQVAVGQIAMGSTGNNLATFDLAESSNIDSVKISNLTINDAVSPNGAAPLVNLQLWRGGNLLATAGAATPTGNGYAYAFQLPSSTVNAIPKGGSMSLTLKGDVPPYAAGTTPDGSTHVFSVASVSNAVGLASNLPAGVVINNAAGNLQTVWRTAVSISTGALGGGTHTRANPDSVGEIVFKASPAGAAEINKLVITLTGSMATTSLLTPQNLWLNDQSGKNVTASDGAILSISGNQATWIFPSGFQIAAGSSYVFMLQVNSTAVPLVQTDPNNPSSPFVYTTLTAAIQGMNDIQYADSIDGSGTQNIGLPQGSAPLIINQITYIP